MVYFMKLENTKIFTRCLIKTIIIITPKVGRTYKNEALRPKWIAALYFIDSSNRVFIQVHRQELTVYIGSSKL